MSYAALQDVYDLGFTARAFVVVPRAFTPEAPDFDIIDPATGVIRMTGHGYDPNDLVEFVLCASGGSVPFGAPTNVFLSPLRIDSVRFKLMPQGGGTPLTYGDPGQGWGLQIDPERRLQRHLDDAQARIDRALVAQRAPIARDPITNKYPAELIGINARMAARTAIPSLLFADPSAREAKDRIDRMEASDEKTLAEWLSGKPLLPEAPDQSAGIADDAARGWGRRPVGWGARRCP